MTKQMGYYEAQARLVGVDFTDDQAEAIIDVVNAVNAEHESEKHAIIADTAEELPIRAPNEVLKSMHWFEERTDEQDYDVENGKRLAVAVRELAWAVQDNRGMQTKDWARWTNALEAARIIMKENANGKD